MTSPETDEPVTAEPATRREPWPGFWPWVATTVLLLAMIGALAWHLQTREAQVVEVVGPTPPPAEPAPELVAEASDLKQQILLRQKRLEEAIASLDPPRCEPPKVIDQKLLDIVRKNEADNLRRWRGLLTPASLGTSPSTLPQSTQPADSTPIRRQAALTPPADGSLELLSTNAQRQRLESASVIVIGLSGGAATGAKPGLQTGSGFFISPTTVVTNAHVIDKADPKQLYVTSDAFDRVQAVTLRATTGGAAGPSQIGKADFAILELVSGTSPAFMPLSSSREKLTEVIAAGYPGMTLGNDGGFQRLLAGDLSEAPDLFMNRGEIRSIQALQTITQIVHTADVLKGYSGGPLMDTCGRVIGVNTFIQVDQQQASKLNNAIASRDLAGFLAQHQVNVALDDRVCPVQ